MATVGFKGLTLHIITPFRSILWSQTFAINCKLDMIITTCMLTIVVECWWNIFTAIEKRSLLRD